MMWTVKPTRSETPGRVSQTVFAEPEQDPVLIALSGPFAGRTYRVGDELIIGREGDCSVMLDSLVVSRHHARVLRQGSRRWVIEDLGSQNGTEVNGEHTMAAEIAFGDRIRIGGEHIFLFSPHDALQEQLLRQQRMDALGQLAGGISHDFNNILAAVVANASVLEELDPSLPVGSELIREIVADILAAARQAGELTRQILAFARRTPAESEPVDLAEVLDEVITLFHRTFRDSIRFERSIAEELIVLGDRMLLHQLMMNVLLNAKDAMPSGGRIRVRAERVSGIICGRPPGAGEQQVLLSIEDEGCGMDDETRNRAFEPYFTMKQPGLGTGLGLAVVDSIAKSHGADVRIESTPGKGTVFVASFPASVGDARLTVPGESRCEPVDGAR